MSAAKKQKNGQLICINEVTIDSAKNYQHAVRVNNLSASPVSATRLQLSNLINTYGKAQVIKQLNYLLDEDVSK